MARDIRVTERMRAEVLVEGFNIFNHVQLQRLWHDVYTPRARGHDAAGHADPTHRQLGILRAE